MKIAFLIGTNDVGGAEYVSYQHVLMAHRNGLNIIVLSGTGGKFHDLLTAEGVNLFIVGMNPTENELEPLLMGCDVLFNCNALGMISTIINLKRKLGFSHLLILHNDTNWIYTNIILKYDQDIDLYYAIHKKIVNAFTSKGGSSIDKFVVIPNCVDYKTINRPDYLKRRMEVRQELGFTSQNFVIGMVTRVAGDKNILDALKMFKGLPDMMNARLLIVGGAAANSGSENYCLKVKQAIKKDPLLKGKVFVLGNCEIREVYRYLSAFDVGLNCSPSEGLPIALLEMMAAEIPCIMPSIGDIPDVLTGRGLVVPIRQRFEIREIFAIPCYTQDEIKLFIKAIHFLYYNKAQRYVFGRAAKDYIERERSLQVQEKLFLKFITMGTKGNQKGEDTVVDLKGAIQKMPLPTVSVLMPTRDGNVEWIDQAVESIARQDYAGEIELVLVNHDCRLSMTAELSRILERHFTESKFKVRNIVIKNPNLTFSQVLDEGVNACSGEIIVRMDHDDVADPKLVSKQVSFLMSHPEIHLVGVQLSFFEGKRMITHHPPLVTREYAISIPKWWFVNHPGVAMRKKTLIELGGYGLTKDGYAEDYTLWCKYIKAGYIIANQPDVLMDYRCYNKRVRPDDYIEYLEKQKESLKL
jgi:glycosyltransferase involved in cell wall biosynthesis